MPPNNTRRQIVAQAIQARKRPTSGGTTAPRSAARSRSTGLNRGRPAPRGIGVGHGQALRPNPTPGLGGAAPAPGGPAPTPWDSRYEQTVAGSNKKYLDAYANFDLAEQGAKQDYGLDPGFNDYKANPNSRAALLEESFKQGNRSVMNNAGLQLYSGSTSNRLGANRATYGTKRDGLQRDYLAAINEINTGRAEAAQAKAEEEQQAYWDRIAAAEDAPLDAEAAPASGKAKGKSKPKPKPKPAPAVANAKPAKGKKK